MEAEADSSAYVEPGYDKNVACQEGGENVAYIEGEENAAYYEGGENIAYTEDGENVAYGEGGENFAYGEGGENAAYNVEGGDCGIEAISHEGKTARKRIWDFDTTHTTEDPETECIVDIYLANTHDNITEDVLLDFMTENRLRVKEFKTQSWSLFAQVELTKREDVNKALALSGKKINGQEIRVEKKLFRTYGPLSVDEKQVLMVRNLPRTATVKLLEKIYTKARQIRLPVCKDRTLRGFGFLEFRSIDDAQYTLQHKAEHELHGNLLQLITYSSKKPDFKNKRFSMKKARLSTESGSGASDSSGLPTVLFVANLNFETTPEILKNFLKAETCNVLKHPDGKPKGVGFAHFKSGHSALAALSDMNGKKLQGRLLELSYPRNSNQGAGFGVPGGGTYRDRGSATGFGDSHPTANPLHPRTSRIDSFARGPRDRDNLAYGCGIDAPLGLERESRLLGSRSKLLEEKLARGHGSYMDLERGVPGDRLDLGGDRLGLGGDRLGLGGDRLGLGGDRLGLGDDRLGLGEDRLGLGRERLVLAGDRVGLDSYGSYFGGYVTDRQGYADERFALADRRSLGDKILGLRSDRLGVRGDGLDRLGLLERDRLGLERERLGLGGDRLGLGRDRYGLGGDRFGLEDDRLGVMDDEFGLDQGMDMQGLGVDSMGLARGPHHLDRRNVGEFDKTRERR